MASETCARQRLIYEVLQTPKCRPLKLALKRLDSREFLKFRPIEIHFGSDYGCCTVSIGETKVVAQVSCDITEPRAVRPNEGMLFVNVDIPELVSPLEDTGLQINSGVRINRLIEKCIKESRAVDLESLCIIAEEQVWELRVDINVLNADGNLATCCSLAALAALAHFKTPQITVQESEIIVHPVKEREPLPLSLHHFPLLITFILFSEGQLILLDPTEIEEKVCDAVLIFGMNSYRELCGMHFGGNAIGDQSLILKCSKAAAEWSIELVTMIKEKLEEDRKTRLENPQDVPGLSSCIHLERMLSACKDREALKLTVDEVRTAIKLQETNKRKIEFESSEEDEEMGDQTDNGVSLTQKGGAILTAVKLEGMNWVPTEGRSAWEVEEEGDFSEDSEDEVELVKTITDEDRIIDKIELSGDSEEDEKIVLEGKDMQ